MSGERVRVGDLSLRRTISAVFQGLGLSAEDAVEGADVLVMTDLRGVDSHGANMLRSYVQQFRDGILNPSPHWRVVADFPATSTIDADRALSITLGRQFMNMAMEKARSLGVGVVTVSNSGHLGAVGHFAMIAAEEDMVGVCMTASSGGVGVVPTFGAEPRLGANPMSLAAPAGEEAPLLMDVSASIPIANKVQLLREAGLPVPGGWISDASGTPIMEPVAAPEPGSYYHLPLGSTREMGSHKGYALSLIPEVLATLLSGAQPAMQTLHNGMKGYFAAYDISKFTDLEQFKANMDSMLRTLRETRPAPGHDRVLYPGLLEHEKEKERRANGIPMDRDLFHWFTGIAEELSVPPLETTNEL